MLPFHEISDLPFRIGGGVFFDFPAHWQDSVEVIHVTEGAAEVQVDGVNHVFSQGQTIFINPGEIHRYIKRQGSARIIMLIFKPSALHSRLPYFEGRRICPHITSSQQAGNLLNRLSDCYKTRTGGWELEAYGYLHLLGAFMVREMQWEEKGVEERQRLTRLAGLKNALEFTQENISNDINLKSAADAAGYSVFHFARLFKQVTGTTYMEYLAQLRLQKAEQLLVQTAHPVTGVASECGFSNVKTFNRLFKKRTGCSPTAFRNSKI